MELIKDIKPKWSAEERDAFIRMLTTWSVSLDFPHYLFESVLQSKFEYMKWTEQMPFIHWPEGWGVKAIPNFCGSIVRYKVKLPGGRETSIYLDCYDNLGCYGAPYWEAYPVNGDTFRCDMLETANLLKAIEEGGGK